MRAIIQSLSIVALAALSIAVLPVAAHECDHPGQLRELAQVIAANHVFDLEVARIEAVWCGSRRQGLTGLGDPYTEYLSVAQYAAVKAQRDGHYQGFGVELVDDAGDYPLLFPLNLGPLAGLGYEDEVELRRIDGQDAGASSADPIKALLSDAAKPTREMLLRRRDGCAKTVRVTRGDVKSLPLEVRSNAYIRIYRFEQGIASRLRSAIEQLHSPRPLVLDLRFASGGEFVAAVDAAKLFVRSGRPIVSLQEKEGEVQVFRQAAVTPLWTHTVILLVGSNTASAAEVFVAALRNEAGATVVGATTTGKCLTQRYFKLPSGAAVKVTERKILYSDGHYCNGKGIEPTIGVTLPVLYDTRKLLKRAGAMILPTLVGLCLRQTLPNRKAMRIKAAELALLLGKRRPRFYSGAGGGREVRLCIELLQDPGNSSVAEFKKELEALLGQDFE